MQAIQHIKQGLKGLFITSLELLQVRLEMARIELVQQKERLIFTLVFALMGLILMLIALMSGLFALNALILDPTLKAKLFFGISAFALVLVVIFALIIIRTLRQQRSFMSETLNELKLDIASLKKLANRANSAPD